VDLATYIRMLHKQSPKNAKQQTKILIKYKIDQLNPQKFMLKVDMSKVSHAKNQNHRPNGKHGKIIHEHCIA
jgi:hypothetical protein